MSVLYRDSDIQLAATGTVSFYRPPLSGASSRPASLTLGPAAGVVRDGFVVAGAWLSGHRSPPPVL